MPHTCRGLPHTACVGVEDQATGRRRGKTTRHHTTSRICYESLGRMKDASRRGATIRNRCAHDASPAAGHGGALGPPNLAKYNGASDGPRATTAL